MREGNGSTEPQWEATQGMTHVKPISKGPVKAQTALASKLQFIESFIILSVDIATTLGTAFFVNSLGLGSVIDIVFGEDEEPA